MLAISTQMTRGVERRDLGRAIEGAAVGAEGAHQSTPSFSKEERPPSFAAARFTAAHAMPRPCSEL